ncbi:MAG: hypothetical protein KC505_01905 [Myxococcales bacterium]|nr:hypothetical protein [Myxococcales bacterium]USN51009.1 MAG: non-canonical purine NTP pyrophosphatase [Myxococcales bacterium]
MTRKIGEHRVVIASHNMGKIKEITALFEGHAIETTSARALDLNVPEENGKTYLENALIKARACVEATDDVSLGDDSGLEVEALGKQPGLYTAPFTVEQGGLALVFQKWQQNEAIMKDPRAAFLCTQVLVWPDGHYEHFEAKINGRLVFPPRGNNGHGYDPIFMPDGYDKTMAEMTFEEKQRCSHRFVALKALLEKVL